jgi:hypothetical protein
MKEPPYKEDYTQLAKDTLEIARYKGYKFRKARKLDSWVKFAWSALFRRKITDFDIETLKRFLEKRESVNEKVKLNKIAGDDKYRKIGHTDRIHQNQFIGNDGYIYMNKMMYQGKDNNPTETKRLNELLKEAKADKEKRFEGYEQKLLKEQARNLWFNNHYYLKDRKLYKK